jgi:hypothetical protein
MAPSPGPAKLVVRIAGRARPWDERTTVRQARAPNVPPTTVNGGSWRSVSVTADKANTSTQKHKTVGQRGSDLRWKWWPEAESNRRPSDFQSGSPTSLTTEPHAVSAPRTIIRPDTVGSPYQVGSHADGSGSIPVIRYTNGNRCRTSEPSTTSHMTAAPTCRSC